VSAPGPADVLGQFDMTAPVTGRRDARRRARAARLRVEQTLRVFRRIVRR
jgi:hypothetical protein